MSVFKHSPQKTKVHLKQAVNPRFYFPTSKNRPFQNRFLLSRSLSSIYDLLFQMEKNKKIKNKNKKSNKRKYYFQNVSSSGETKPPENFCVRRVDLRVQPQEQRYTHSYQCTVPSCVQAKVYGYQCLGFLMCAQLVETKTIFVAPRNRTRASTEPGFSAQCTPRYKNNQNRKKRRKNERKEGKNNNESGSS